MTPLDALDGVPVRHLTLAPAGVRLHVVEAGPPDGMAVLLLHGFPEYSYGWRKIVPELARAGYRVIVPDQRGYAASEAPAEVAAYRISNLLADAVGLLDALGVGDAHVVGHDWGGVIAWALGTGHPARVRSLTVVNCPHPIAFERHLRASPRQLARSWYMGLFQVPWLPERLMASPPGTRRGLWRTLAQTSAPGAFTPDELDRYAAEAWASPAALRGPVGWYRAAARGGGGFPRGRVTPPMQLVWGTADHALGTELAAPSLGWADDGRLVEVAGCSHWVPAERPDALLTALHELFTDSGGPDRFVYKIAGAAPWAAAGAAWEGSADDLRDGFVHLSSRHQVDGTLARHFAGRTGLTLLTVDPARLPAGALRWERSRGGARFPHLYAPLPRAAVVAEAPIGG